MKPARRPYDAQRFRILEFRPRDEPDHAAWAAVLFAASCVIAAVWYWSVKQ